jgi:HlyD family secretion protein
MTTGWRAIVWRWQTSRQLQGTTDMLNYSLQNKIKFTAISLLLLGAAACSKPEEEAHESAIPVQTAVAQKMPISRFIQAQAILYPQDQASVTPKISAPVSKFYVNRGDHVRKGQLLAELENRDLTAAALEAKANYDQAEANNRNTATATLPDEVAKSQSEIQSDKEALDAAQKLNQSRKTLFEQGALPRKLLDESQVAYAQARSQYEIAQQHLQSLLKVSREAQIKSAQAQLEAAKSHLNAVEAQLQYSKIISPIDGVVSDRPLYEGETASAGTPLITIMNISEVIARANLPVDELRFIKDGNSATIKLLDSSIEAPGKVIVVSPALNPNSTTAEVWVRASNPAGRMHPGASVQASISAGTVPDALVIPASALLPSSEGVADTVLVAGTDSTAHKRQVEIGIKEGDKIQILKGLTAGDRVVTAGGYGIQDGAKIRIENELAGKSDQHDESKTEK